MSERDIFLTWLELPDAQTRAAFLNRVCAHDAALRAGVDALVRSHIQAGDFLGTPAVAPDAAMTQEMPAPHSPSPDDESLSFLAPSLRPDSLGRIGHYEVLEVLGHGGFGIVLRAFDEVLQRVVAIKVLSPHLAVTSPARKRFLREARASARVRHENVVHVYAVVEQPFPYLVMEYIPGETLQQRLDRTGPLDAAEVAHLGRQIAEGLAAAHASGLVHRDIKPANILIEAGRSQVKITDFGLARAADDASLTQSGLVAGTPLYMSPEQARGEAIDERTDLFSLGSVLYTLGSGRPPFRASGSLAVLKRVAEDTPRPISQIIPEVPAWLCAIISRLHAKRPADRFASAREVADLLAGQQNRSETKPLPRPVQQRSPRIRTERWWAVAASVVILCLAGIGLTEASGVTNVRGTVVRLFSPNGTLVVEVDDPGVSVTIDGEDMVITGTGAKEIRLKPGVYKVRTNRDGKPTSEELVRVERNGKQVVRISREAPPPVVDRADAAKWEQSVAALSAEQQVEAVAARMKQLNPGFDGVLTTTIEKQVVREVRFSSTAVTDLSPLRALKQLRLLSCGGVAGPGKLTDLSPLRGLPLTVLLCHNTSVADLSPLRGMPLKELAIQHTRVKDLKPLTDVPLEHLNASHTAVSDLSPLKGKKLISLYLDCAPLADLSPLRDMPLKLLNLRSVVLQGKRDAPVLRSLTALEAINGNPPTEYFAMLEGE